MQIEAKMCIREKLYYVPCLDRRYPTTASFSSLVLILAKYPPTSLHIYEKNVVFWLLLTNKDFLIYLCFLQSL